MVLYSIHEGFLATSALREKSKWKQLPRTASRIDASKMSLLQQYLKKLFHQGLGETEVVGLLFSTYFLWE